MSFYVTLQITTFHHKEEKMKQGVDLEIHGCNNLEIGPVECTSSDQ